VPTFPSPIHHTRPNLTTLAYPFPLSFAAQHGQNPLPSKP
jgi:hypothetical protein